VSIRLYAGYLSSLRRFTCLFTHRPTSEPGDPRSLATRLRLVARLIGGIPDEYGNVVALVTSADLNMFARYDVYLTKCEAARCMGVAEPPVDGARIPVLLIFQGLMESARPIQVSPEDPANTYVDLVIALERYENCWKEFTAARVPSTDTLGILIQSRKDYLRAFARSLGCL